MRRPVFFIGARASGKTTLGRLLAERQGVPFSDTDDLVTQALGCSIAEYVEREGWEAFRDRESEALRSVCGGDAPGVVACGGGVVLRPVNRELLRCGLVLHMHATAGVLAGRLAADPNEAQRPSLTGKGLLDEVVEVLVQREPLYLECADIVLDADRPPHVLLDEIEGHLADGGR